MIKFEINGNTYQLVADKYCWAIQRKHIKGPESKTPGEIAWINQIFSNEFEHIAKWLINQGVKEYAGLYSAVEQLEQAIKVVSAEIRNTMRRIEE